MIGEQPDKEVPRKGGLTCEELRLFAGFYQVQNWALFLFYNKSGWLVNGEGAAGCCFLIAQVQN